jgi:hypothetical protein
MMKPTTEQLTVLNEQTVPTLALWWCQLNRHQWPKELPVFVADEELEESPVWIVMTWIMERIGFKECLRVWNNESMSKEEFEQWYSERFRQRGSRRLVG